MFRDRFWLTLVLAIPVVIWSHHVQELLGYTAPQFPGSELIGPVLGSVIFFYGGWPFLTGGLQEARDRDAGDDAADRAWRSRSPTWRRWPPRSGLFDQEVWWELALLIAIMLLGHWIEMRAIGQAQGALAALAELLPDDAERVAARRSTETVRVADLARRRRGAGPSRRPGPRRRDGRRGHRRTSTSR